MNIVAIGGGNKDRAVDEAINRSGNTKPDVLLIPSACSTEASYERKVSLLKTYFRERGATASTLHEFNKEPSRTRIAHEIGKASLLYTIGGNSPYMLRTMREHGTDSAIADAIRSGKVHAGVSAGALLPFELAHSCVAAKPAETEWDYEILHGLGVVPGVATAHANQHDPTSNGMRLDSRKDALLEKFPLDANRGYAINNGGAFIFSSTDPLVIANDRTAPGYTLERSANNIISFREAIDSDLVI